MFLKDKLANNIKNLQGWKSKRKLLAFAVDDYGNIRLSNLEARSKLKESGVRLEGRFDNYDSIDTRKDYELLFEVLESVKDQNERSAVFTTYAMPANVAFQDTLEQRRFVPENLDATYARLAQKDPDSFDGAFSLMQEGIRKKLIKPQFHGREHLNVLVFNLLLQEGNAELLTCLKENCLVGIPNHKDRPNVRFSEAFSFWDKLEIEGHRTIIEDGIYRFEKVYGYKPTVFTPPSMLIHPKLYPFVESQGILAIDKPRVHEVHLGEGEFRREKNKLGVQEGQRHVTIVRNCLFEPNSRNIDWVNFTFNQVKAAFFWGKPAIISSHRVNFCGHIDPDNRKKSLQQLKALLQKVVKTWPDVEFVGVDELAETIKSRYN